MSEDQRLLRDYADKGAREALEELVRRHLTLVYSSALRQVRDSHLAEDVTQAVFLVLMRKAGTIRSGVALGGWLLAVTRCTAVNAMKRRTIQKKHEVLAARPETSQAAEQWEEVEPVLDGELNRLAAADRDAIVLRFFQARSFAQIAAELGLSERTARKRVDRALERLRVRLGGRRRSETAGALGVLIGVYAMQAAPRSLSARMVVARLGSPAPHCLSLAKGAMKMVAWTRMRAAGAVAAAVLGCLAIAWAGHALAGPGDTRGPMVVARNSAVPPEVVGAGVIIDSELKTETMTSVAGADATAGPDQPSTALPAGGAWGGGATLIAVGPVTGWGSVGVPGAPLDGDKVDAPDGFSKLPGNPAPMRAPEGAVPLALAMVASVDAPPAKAAPTAAASQPAAEQFVTFTQRMSMQGHPDMLMQFAESDRGFTSAVNPNGVRNVSDLHTGERVEFNDNAKTAEIFAGHSNPTLHPPERTMVQRYMDMVHDEARDAGVDRVDGRNVEKYTLFKPSVSLGGITTSPTTYTIWVEKTQLVRVLAESTTPPNMPAIKMSTLSSNFQYVSKLPANKLSLEAPLGYKVTSSKPAIVGNKTSICYAYPDIGAYVAKHTAAVVHDGLSTDGNTGVFPAELGAVSTTIHFNGADVVGLTAASNVGEGWFARVNVGRWLADLPKGSWGYPGAGKTRGNADELIFWCKSTGGYQGVYGDLSVKALDAKSLPKGVGKN